MEGREMCCKRSEEEASVLNQPWSGLSLLFWGPGSF